MERRRGGKLFAQIGMSEQETKGTSERQKASSKKGRQGQPACVKSDLSNFVI